MLYKTGLAPSNILSVSAIFYSDATFLLNCGEKPDVLTQDHYLQVRRGEQQNGLHVFSVRGNKSLLHRKLIN